MQGDHPSDVDHYHKLHGNTTANTSTTGGVSSSLAANNGGYYHQQQQQFLKQQPNIQPLLPHHYPQQGKLIDDHREYFNPQQQIQQQRHSNTIATASTKESYSHLKITQNSNQFPIHVGIPAGQQQLQQQYLLSPNIHTLPSKQHLQDIVETMDNSSLLVDYHSQQQYIPPTNNSPATTGNGFPHFPSKSLFGGHHNTPNTSPSTSTSSLPIPTKEDNTVAALDTTPTLEHPKRQVTIHISLSSSIFENHYPSLYLVNLMFSILSSYICSMNICKISSIWGVQ